MLIKKNGELAVIDTLAYTPFYPEIITETHVTPGVTLGHWKINNSLKYIDENDVEKEISVRNSDGSMKTKEEVYEMLTTWEIETVFSAFFNKDFEAGNIKGGGEDIEHIVIKRLSADSDYTVYETLAKLPFNRDTKYLGFKDYLIVSGQVYLYSVQPVTNENHFGQLQNKKAGLNRYEYTWLIDKTGTHLKLSNCKIEGNVSHNVKDGIIETIGREFPLQNRFSNLDYKTFTIKGTIASVFDDFDHVTPEVEKEIYGSRKDIQKLISQKFIERTGELPSKISNGMKIDYNFERAFREKVVSVLKNGEEKILKSPSEGMLVVKLTNIQLSPMRHIDGLIQDFTAQVTEVSNFNKDVLENFTFEESMEVLYNE